MRWKSVIMLVPVAAITGILLAALFFRQLRVDESNDVAQEMSSSTPEDLLAEIQLQLKTAKEFDAQLQITIYFQGPVPIQIAWRKPEFFFIHVGAFGDNPATWYWFENQQLHVYEEWPMQRARGVCVTNLMQIAEGDAKRGFDLVLSASEFHAYLGYIALELLDLLKDAAAERLEINETETLWQLTGAPDAFDAKLIEPFDTDDRTSARFELPKADHAQSWITAIRIEYESVLPGPENSIPPDAGIIAEFESLQFSFDRERLTFPHPPHDLMKIVEVKDIDALMEVMNSLRLVRIVE